MANMKTINIKGKLFTLKQISSEYSVSYSTVKRYYSKGLRGEKLLNQIKILKRGFTYKNKVFESKLQAAEYFNIPKTTFYRQISMLSSNN